MAGSGFPPLTNIPYCCLPQESGPCLSTSVGDRPLRSPSHRSLGGPSPRQQANGTHARPRPHRCFIPWRMPSKGTMAYYPAFPPAIRLSGVGCIRVAHPCATLKAPEGAFPVRLACIRPAASVHPEPGSNSSLYYCIPCMYSESRVPPQCSLGVPFKRSLPSRRSRGAGILCWPQTFKELPALGSPLFVPSSVPKAGAKVLPFSELASTFFKYFSSFFHHTDYQREKSSSCFHFSRF